MRARIITAVALLVIASCGAAWALTAREDRSASLVGRPTWQLAGALPASSDFPPDWGYTLTGQLGRVTPQPVPATRQPEGPDSFRPAECGQLLPIDQMPGQLGNGAGASVDVNLPGEGYQLGHKAHFYLYAVDDPGALIAQYTDWVRGCSNYHYSGTNPSSGQVVDRDVTRVVDTELPDGADFGVSVDGKRMSGDGSRMYYAVRGVIVQAWTTMEGDDQELIGDLVAQTVRRLRAL